MPKRDPDKPNPFKDLNVKDMDVLAGLASTLLGLIAAVFPDGSVKLGLLVIAMVMLLYFIASTTGILKAGIAFLSMAAIVIAGYTLTQLPLTLTGTLLQVDGSPAGVTEVVLFDNNGVPHNIEVGADGAFSVGSLPDGNFKLTSASKPVYTGAVPNGWQRLLALNKVDIGHIYVPSETTEEPPDGSPPPPPQAWCQDWPICEVMPQGEGTGGAVFSWLNYPGGFTYGISPVCARSGEFGLQMEYGFSDPGSGGWGISWGRSTSGKFDASQFNYLDLWTRSRDGVESFQIGLKDTAGHEIKIDTLNDLHLSLSNQTWTSIHIPLSSFGPTLQRDSLDMVNVGFTGQHRGGLVCVDDISFTK